LTDGTQVEGYLIKSTAMFGAALAAVPGQLADPNRRGSSTGPAGACPTGISPAGAWLADAGTGRGDHRDDLSW
jgi:hypothetical protein